MSKNLTEIDPCKKFACEWQDCLKRSDYQEEKCKGIIEKLKECCLKNYDKREIEVKEIKSIRYISPTCSGFVN